MLENTNIKQFYPGPILNKTLDITDFLFKDPEQVHITYTYKNEDGSLSNRELTYGTEYEVAKILPSDVTQADAALTASTGRVTLKAALNVALGERLTVYRESAIIQEAQYPRTGPFPAASHEGALDYLTMQNQEQQDQIDRSLKVPISTANFDGALPIPVPARALKINNSGSGFELSEYDPDTALETTKEYMEGAQTAASNALASQNAAASSANSAASSETVATQQANIAIAKTAEITETYNNAMADITSNKEQSMSAINENRETSLAEIESAKSGAVSSINTTKDNAVSTVKQTGTDEYNKILSTGIDSKLGENLITNCLKEIPQRIKYTLVDGVLTILKGSVCIIPYGTKDKTADLPKGATFINKNFRVYDTQYTEDSDGKGKFFVWAELVNDLSDGDKTAQDNLTRLLEIDLVNNNFIHYIDTTSGTTDYSGAGNQLLYKTDENIIKRWAQGSNISNVVSFPLGFIKSDSSTKLVYSSIDEVFNGMGVIGSTIWTDKGVKGLVSIDRNEADGTLINKVVVIDKLNIITLGNYTAPAATLAYLSEKLWDNQLDYVPNDIIYEQNAKPSIASNYRWYDTINGKWFINDTGATVSKYSPWLKLADMSYVNGKITSFTPKLPFRAADENDIDGKWIIKSQQIINSPTTLTNGSLQYRDYDISNYLPNGGCVYEILIEILGESGMATNAWAHYWVSDANKGGQACSCGAKSFSNTPAYIYGNGILPISSRTLRLYWSSSGAGIPIINTLRLAGYRKVR